MAPATQLTHPLWCAVVDCTAYRSPDELDRLAHRSEPLVIETEDPAVRLWGYLVAAPGAEPEITISELELEQSVPWWAAPAVMGREVVLSVDQGDALRHLLDGLVSAARKEAER